MKFFLFVTLKGRGRKPFFYKISSSLKSVTYKKIHVIFSSVLGYDSIFIEILKKNSFRELGSIEIHK